MTKTSNRIIGRLNEEPITEIMLTQPELASPSVREFLAELSHTPHTPRPQTNQGGCL
jgi:hypothetical protein